ncbi:MAG: LPD16 domain-containing protein, partial [Mobilitalea sp.]
MADKIATQKEKLKEITDGIEQGIQELFDSEKYKQYLRTMSKFPRYSLNNTILIFLQNPNATFVAGFGRWQEQFERHVRKGEKGLKIIAPTPYNMKKEVEKVDPVTKKHVVDATGKLLKEEVEVTIPMFKPVTVFDVSQTEGKPLPELAPSLAGDVNGYQTLFEALKRTAPVPVTFEYMKERVDGYFNHTEQRIALRSGMSEVQTVSAVIHEIAHSILHNKELDPTQTAEKDQVLEQIKNRRTKEVEAESVSYTVCSYYGIETNENSFGYIASWSKDKELTELKASLELINQTASRLITEIDAHLTKIQEEKNYEVLKQKEALYLLDDTTYLQVQQSEEGYGYMFYDQETQQEMDGGQLNTPSLDIIGARSEILAFHELTPGRIEEVSYNLIEVLEEANKIVVLPDSYRILQLNREEDLRDHRFESLERLEEMGLRVEEVNYHEVYEGMFTDEATTNV